MIFVRWIYEQWMIHTKVVQFLADRLFFPPSWLRGFVASCESNRPAPPSDGVSPHLLSPALERWGQSSSVESGPRAMGSVLIC